MRYQLSVAIAILFGGLSSVVTGAVVEIHVGGYYFLPQFANVQPGDTVRWIHDGGTHDVTSGFNCSDDSSLFYSPITTASPTFEWTVPAEFDQDVIPYYCSVGNHCVSSDQFGALLVNVEAHYLSTNGLAFEPAHVDVNAGDAIFWLHAGGTHTVTSGTGCIADGLFDVPLDNFNPMPFVIIQPDEPSGVIDYYCQPHCGSGMTGTIGVVGNDPLGACCFMSTGCSEAMTEDDCGSDWYEGQTCAEVTCPTCVGDINGDGAVTVDDLLQLLAVYGTACDGCPEDIDGNGMVSVDDLLQLLATFGSDC
jgi:plastocyanin